MGAFASFSILRFCDCAVAGDGVVCGVVVRVSWV